jgi:hypothetical protein
VETQQVEARGLALVERSRAVVVIDAPSYAAAGGFLKDIKAYRAQVAEVCEPVVKAAHAAHKAAVAQRERLDGPADEAERIVKATMLAWKRAEDARVTEARRAAEFEARRKAEDALLAEAAEAEAAGQHAKAEAIVSAPVVVRPVAVSTDVPKVAGVSVRTTWAYEIVDPTLLPREFLKPDEHAIGATVRATRGALAIPGVRTFEKPVMAV